jgi:hypothetical protein
MNIFLSGWLQGGNISYLDKVEQQLFLGVKFSPSQRLDDDPRNVWICTKEDDCLIERAYCSCTAG